MTRKEQAPLKPLLLCFTLLLFSNQLFASSDDNHQYSSAPDTSRFEIVQSELAARLTLKIDKNTGEVFQLLNADSGFTWQLISAETHPDDWQGSGSSIGYQVFTSGIGVRFTYLLNVNTGATWQLSEDSDSKIYWKVIK